MKIIALIIGLALLAASCQPKEDAGSNQATSEEISQTIYFNGDIVTMAGDLPEYAEALVEQQGRIIYVGSKEGAYGQLDGNANEVDLAGKTLLPGFIDGHGHLYNTGFFSLCANLLPPPDGPGANFEGLIQTVNEWKSTEDGQLVSSKLGWIVGVGYDDSQLEEKLHPTKSDLDQISTEVPVIIIHQSSHLSVVNTKGLELSGYDSSTEIPGGVIRKDAQGQPTGVLEEAAFFNLFLPIITQKTDSALQVLNVLKGQEQYVSNGYTTAQDGRSTPDVTAALAEAAQSENLFIDIVSYPDIIWNKAALTPEYYTADHSYNNHYRVGGVKLTLDGSPQGKTAWLSQCYHVNPEGQEGCYKGYPIMDDETAIAYVKTAFENQWQLLCHTNGDEAIAQYIRAIDAASEDFGYADHRSVMIHGQTLRNDQIPELVRLQIFPSLFPMHTYYWGDWHRASVLGEERAAYISPSRDVIDAGLTMTSHHDAPVTFPNSMRVLHATVNRITRSGYVLGADQRISVYEGLKTLTEWAAHQYFEEDTKGTLEKGKLADMVILDRNPLKMDPMDILDVKVVTSIKEGQVVYSLD